ncbi:hypothetical protein FSP39_004539 [Pinctada imbricata]|uniref:PKD/Chitinase domain-containing protein n=1 Tax=Pinctada imbricata TaxID=66713 RepID=A0AA89BYG0_PINIB|nr:hypothetical protein FSP39_004539 [Pinctada imbricata]
MTSLSVNIEPMESVTTLREKLAFEMANLKLVLSIKWQRDKLLLSFVIVRPFPSSSNKTDSWPLSRGAIAADICSDDTKQEDLKSKLHHRSIPKGGTSAGNYLKDNKSKTISECILSCCDDATNCDTVFFHQNTCFLIKCNVTYQGSCDPVPRSEPKYNGTYLVNVRDVVYGQCEISTGVGCPEHEVCQETKATFSSDPHTICVCEHGYARSVVTHQCVASPDTTGTASHVTPPPIDHKLKSCEYGLQECDKNQECFIPKDSKKRIGICVCADGFHMDSNFQCVLKSGEKKSSIVTTPGTRRPVTTSPTITKLTVSAGSNKTIQLPTDTITLNVYVVEKEEDGEHFEYDWSLISSPKGAEKGVMTGKNTDTLKLSKMIAGLYCFKIKVTGKNRVGDAFVNVTVSPPKRENKAPVAIIKPADQVVKLPNSAILDGSDSYDDDKITKYHWEETSGPLRDQTLEEDGQMLNLKNLVPGTYLFKLTVTDSDGAENSTVANVTVVKETDYPPKANAGSDVVIYLPQDSVILYGNQSTDDKGIKSYEWMKSSDDKETADMTGTSTPFLHLSNLQEGDYTFTLKVTDTNDQSSMATVHLFVKPDINTAPKAVTAGKITKIVPIPKLILDGRNSTDDKKITKYTWVQTGGATLNLKDADQAIAEATGNIQAGMYEFTLTVSDMEKLQSTAKLTVEVKQLPNKAPVANAGGDRTITLPQLLVTVDGSKSSDDKGIVDYKWTRQSTSQAAGYILNGSDHQAVLQLVNLVAGRYSFILTVMDAEGLTNSDTASLTVNEDPNSEDLLEMTLDTDLYQFTEDDKTNIKKQIARMLPKSPDGDTVMDIQTMDEDRQTGHLHITFYVKNEMKDYHAYRDGVDVMKKLREQLHSSDSHFLGYRVLSLDTYVCQNNCTGHGTCDRRTKLCVCEAFWMSNFFKSFSSTEYSNCDWSVLYFVIVLFLLVVSMATIVWGLICWCKKKRYRCTRWRSKKRHRYSLLNEIDDDREEIQMLPKHKGKIQNSSLMISESDFTSDEETIFVNHKKPNGFIQRPPNGISRQHLKTTTKA